MRTVITLILHCLLAMAALSANGNQLSNAGFPVFDSLTGRQNHLKILSWNIGMLPVVDLFKEKDNRPQAIAKALRDKDYDIIVFQEAFTVYARDIIGRSLQDQYQIGRAHV